MKKDNLIFYKQKRLEIPCISKMANAQQLQLTRIQLARATPQTQVRYKTELQRRQQVLAKAKQEAISRIQTQKVQQQAQQQTTYQQEVREGALSYISKLTRTGSLGVVPEKYKGEVQRLLADPKIAKQVRRGQQKISDPYRFLLSKKIEEIEAQKLDPIIEQAKVSTLTGYKKGVAKPGEPGYWNPELLEKFEAQPQLPGETQYEKVIRISGQEPIKIPSYAEVFLSTKPISLLREPLAKFEEPKPSIYEKYKELDIKLKGRLPFGAPTIRKQVRKQYEVLGKETGDVNKAVKKLDFYDKFIKEGVFVGSDEDWVNYQKDFKKYEKELGEYLTEEEKLKLKEEELEKTISQKAFRKYEETEEKLSEELLKTKPLKYIYEKAPEFAKKVTEIFPFREATGLFKIEEGQIIPVGMPLEMQREIITGLIQEPLEKPVKTGATLGLGYVTGKVTPTIFKILKKTKVGAKIITPTIKFGVPLYYGISVEERIRTEPDFAKRGKIIGGIISTELLPFYVGGKLSQYDKILVKKFFRNQKEIFYDIEGKAGRTQKTKQVVKEKGKTKIKRKINVDKIIEDLTFKREGKIIRNKNFQERFSDIKKIMPKVKTKEQFEAVKKLFNEAYGNAEADILIKEYFAQERDLIPTGRFEGTAPKGKIDVDFIGDDKGFGVVTGRIPTGILDKTITTPKTKTIKLTKPEGKFIVGLEEVLTLKEQQKQKNIIKQLSKLRLKEKLTSEEKQRLKQLEGQIMEFSKLAQPQLVTPALAQPQLVTPALAQPQLEIPALAQPTITRPSPKIKPPIDQIFFYFPEGDSIKKKRKIMRKKRIINGKSYDVQAKPVKQKRFRTIGRRLSEEQAEDWGAEVIDKSLSATFKLKVNPKPPLKPKVPLKRGYYARHREKFRKYKIRKGKRIATPKTYIEKRNKRLDHPSEVKRITMFKKIAELTKKRKKKSKSRRKKNLFGI